MRKLFFAFAILALTLTSCGGGDTVVGTWQLESVTGEELTDSEKEATMTFNEDGTCEQKRGDRVRKATWTMAEDGKSLTLVKEDGGEEEVMESVTLTADKLSFKERDEMVTLKRVK
ncbi:MAG: hypothetical protein ACI837_002579 [Crocinitomicaceae bacterium]|jgi:hypothetical protein